MTLIVLKSNQKDKKGRTKIKGKEGSAPLDTGDKEENIRSRQRKGSALNKTNHLTPVHEPEETNVDGVKKDVHKTRSK